MFLLLAACSLSLAIRGHSKAPKKSLWSKIESTKLLPNPPAGELVSVNAHSQIANLTDIGRTVTGSAAQSSARALFQVATPAGPVLLTDGNSTRAIALNSVTLTSEPFAVTSSSPLGQDRRTRILFFALNANLLPGETASVVTAEALDGSNRLYPLTVEYVGPLQGFGWISCLALRLNDQLTEVGDVLVRISLRGATSNSVRVGLGYIGGGPPDPMPAPTPTSSPTPTPTSSPTPAPTPTSSPTPSPIPGPTPTGSASYVAPNGSPSGNGSITNPWDLQTALSQPSNVQPGATIYLRGGTYMGKYRSRLAGTPSAPITVRSYPGEWAKIEGYLTTTLSAALPNAPGDPVTVVVADGRAFSDPTTVFIGTEILTLNRRQPDGRTWTNCVRAISGTTPAAHSVGDIVFDNSKTLTVSGQYTYYRDFEVANSNPTRDYNFSWGQLAPEVRGSGIFVIGSTGIKFINLVIHDNQDGIFASVAAIDMEIYGSIIYNNGFVDWQRGHGQGLYMQNQVGQKKIRNVISFNNFTDGMKAYSESGFAQNFLFEHVISFNNGSSVSAPGNHGDNGNALPPEKRYPNIFSGTGNSGNPINDIRIHDCYLYHPTDTSPENGNLGLGYLGIGATGLEITNSRIMGGDHAIALAHFLNGTVLGNKVYAQKSGPWTGVANAGLANVSFEINPLMNWNNNSYFDQTPLYQGTTSYPFTYAIAGVAQLSCDGGAALRFSYTGCSPNGGWRQIAGVDSSSTYAYAAPTGTEVLVVPNDYETGRANIAIYNWALAPSVAVDLSNVLQIGDQYVVYAAENYLGPPVLTGTYSGGSVWIPMTGTTVQAPIGLGWTPPTVRPQFGAFVVRRA